MQTRGEIISEVSLRGQNLVFALSELGASFLEGFVHMQMMTWVGRSMAGCLTVALVACSVQQGGESRTEQVVDVKQPLQVLTPEAKATKRLQDIRTVGASIDADKEELARGGYTDQADYEAKVASIAVRTYRRWPALYV